MISLQCIHNVFTGSFSPLTSPGGGRLGLASLVRFHLINRNRFTFNRISAIFTALEYTQCIRFFHEHYRASITPCLSILRWRVSAALQEHQTTLLTNSSSYVYIVSRMYLSVCVVSSHLPQKHFYVFMSYVPPCYPIPYTLYLVYIVSPYHWFSLAGQ